MIDSERCEHASNNGSIDESGRTPSDNIAPVRERNVCRRLSQPKSSSIVNYLSELRVCRRGGSKQHPVEFGLALTTLKGNAILFSLLYVPFVLLFVDLFRSKPNKSI